ncbi:MAG: hypothetical protein COT00_04570 [Candidatus Omnitrophica bacterium CG07_land_8_20_14_0_80_50_8]|nr:MAG: hypothetical protein COT00_04570 [Candidatus Omnitrophica bacterium CG07_land_8_20_14_0_80_50_8]
MKRFVIGDIHGAHKALLQCFERSGFDRDRDLLISLGDVCDGWPQVNQSIEELLRVKHLKVILGNHDQWTLKWMTDGWKEELWLSQGGAATMESYRRDPKLVPESHKHLLQEAALFIELDNKLFVHGGINPGLTLDKQNPEILLWDRDLLNKAVKICKKTPDHRYGKWENIFVGHTATEYYRTFEPIHACNVWAMDTGAGWSGKLTIMDMDSTQYWQSDLTPSLYPNISGRR